MKLLVADIPKPSYLGVRNRHEVAEMKALEKPLLAFAVIFAKLQLHRCHNDQSPLATL
jgi:hypothetical protein